MSDAEHWRIAQLMCSKLCHDLISPIGAINNGLEILNDSGPDMQGDAIDLVGKSAQQAANRLAFFRVAFGGTGQNDPLEESQIRLLVDNLLAGGRVTLNWTVSPGGDTSAIDRPLGRLILNMALVGIEALPRGGLLNLSLDRAAGGTRVTAEAIGSKCTLADELSRALGEDLDLENINVKNVGGVLIRRLAADLNLSLNVAFSAGESLTLTAS